MAKKSSGGIGLMIVVGLCVAAYKWTQENMDTVLIVGGSMLLIYILLWSHKRKKHAAWMKHLYDKYKDAEVVDGILNSMFWKGMTEEQLIDSLGSPDAIDTQVLKTKRKEIWKYNEVRKGQFATKITVENHKVIGWDKKS
ncbi:hypothetical protein NP590_05010 [Methylomonas sp. SURF-2]|uniref:DUF2845 domain-containing protein n=1 Tax=Methylomonas subterranea TaxID=2952225 RepID=A0ABT1TDE1_9GAMM|nr:hypothetical protein [Methylomonas sp. SURF-2]MCQ8103460.1 hypothetical protein [Methylomonas sp. SURF-2]